MRGRFGTRDRFFELAKDDITYNAVSCVNCRHWRVRGGTYATPTGGAERRVYVLCWKLHHPARRIDTDKVCPAMFGQARMRAVECRDFDPYFVDDDGDE